MLQRFLKYIQIETTSDPKSSTSPSTKCQFDLANTLVDDLKEIGVDECTVTDQCYVYARIKGNPNYPKIGLIAHMDTSPDMYGKCTSPQIISYTGEPIALNDSYELNEKTFPSLKTLVGKTLVCTDGNSLLGADDKAGIVEIIEACKEIIENNIPHGDISICFTPDEEIGRGADHFDLKKFDADIAFTVDGGELGELEYQNFNAASCHIEIHGINIHPGSAKNKMINSQLIAMELHQMLPVNQRPEFTELFEGFYMLTEISGHVELTTMDYIIRDHDKAEFERKKTFIQSVCQFLQEKYATSISCEITDSYYNMYEKIAPHMEIIELARRSMLELGIDPIEGPVRGGTDGAHISYMGLPCPNLFTGGYNFHGRFEFLVLEYAELAKQVIIKIIENSTKEGIL